ncbi:unnamed protein product, partial [Brenthis ino]
MGYLRRDLGVGGRLGAFECVVSFSFGVEFDPDSAFERNYPSRIVPEFPEGDGFLESGDSILRVGSLVFGGDHDGWPGGGWCSYDHFSCRRKLGRGAGDGFRAELLSDGGVRVSYPFSVLLSVGLKIDVQAVNFSLDATQCQEKGLAGCICWGGSRSGDGGGARSLILLCISRASQISCAALMARSLLGAETLLGFSVGVRHFLMTSARVRTIFSKEEVSETSVARTGRTKGSGGGLVALNLGLVVTAALSTGEGINEGGVFFPRRREDEVALLGCDAWRVEEEFCP